MAATTPRPAPPHYIPDLRAPVVLETVHATLASRGFAFAAAPQPNQLWAFNDVAGRDYLECPTHVGKRRGRWIPNALALTLVARDSARGTLVAIRVTGWPQYDAPTDTTARAATTGSCVTTGRLEALLIRRLLEQAE